MDFARLCAVLSLWAFKAKERSDAVGAQRTREAAEDAVLVVSALGVEALAVGRRALREVGVSVVIARSQVTDDARLVARCGRG